jgi:hypothetical protein
VTTDPEKGPTDDVSGAARLAAEEGAAAGSSPSEDEGPDPDAEAAPPEAILELAAACVRFVGQKYGAALDFEPETLSFVDQWLRDARPDLTRRPEVIELVQGAAGAYLGEVIRRAFGGRWVIRGPHPDWKLCLSRVYCSFNPLGMAREALLLDAAEGWHAHLEVDPGEEEGVQHRLAALPPVEDDEYYAPSTRFDVISILFDALRENLRARGLSDVRFTPDDYV